MTNLSDIRSEYSKATLDESTVNADPIVQFKKWFDEVIKSDLPEPNAMTLSTLSEGGRPSARIVLLKGVENGRFLFFTNYQSQKGKELMNNPACALNFFWPHLERQVRIEGVASRVSESASDDYFQTRPRGSQIGAWASPQSTMVKGRTILEERFQQIEKKYESNKAIPRPKQWGGFGVAPLEIEFWQGRPNRLHDRIVYTRVDEKWEIHRLAP